MQFAENTTLIEELSSLPCISDVSQILKTTLVVGGFNPGDIIMIELYSGKLSSLLIKLPLIALIFTAVYLLARYRLRYKNAMNPSQ